MATATAAEVKAIDAAIVAVRKAYSDGSTKVLAATSVFGGDGSDDVKAAWKALGPQIERWAKTWRTWAIEGKRDDGSAFSVARFLEHGRTLADSIRAQSGYAVDANALTWIGQAVAATAEDAIDVANPFAWPLGVKVAVGAVVVVVGLVALAKLSGNLKALKGAA